MKSLRPEKLEINLTSIDSESQLIDELIKQFNFPDLYEKSWEGMEDHLFYDAMMRVPLKLYVVGMEHLRENVPESLEHFEYWLKGIPEVSIK